MALVRWIPFGELHCERHNIHHMKSFRGFHGKTTSRHLKAKRLMKDYQADTGVPTKYPVTKDAMEKLTSAQKFNQR
ncbi:hypothetical protein CHS0354_033867 [Potamilus streckersoni]|uniref:Uncharacterized protein n=1 Tax=Potamilus streckersoni TaxID=2493646 RepID=A0AAE0RWW6_9BIVA|nr:hypothetical protein CHS0354_033867 [Potamilus streckersoni]